MLGLNEAVDQLTIANIVLQYDIVFRRMDGHVMRKERIVIS